MSGFKQYGRAMKFELRPCPFCGHQVRMHELDGMSMFDSKKYYRIQCGRCGARFPTSPDMKGLARRWDRRTNVAVK